MPRPSAVSQRVASFAMESNTVVAELGMVPNQPLFFSDSKDKGRSEDDLIAYSRVKQMQTGDDNWLVRLAMVKSGVRALDAIQEFLASEAGGKLKIDQFVVSGRIEARLDDLAGWSGGQASHRHHADRDRRAELQVITRHHFEAYGFFSPALNDYVNHKLFPDKIGTPEYKHILDDRGRVQLSQSRPAEDSKVSGQRFRRSVLSARQLAVLFRRASRREVPSLRPQRRNTILRAAMRVKACSPFIKRSSTANRARGSRGRKRRMAHW